MCLGCLLETHLKDPKTRLHKNRYSERKDCCRFTIQRYRCSLNKNLSPNSFVLILPNPFYASILLLTAKETEKCGHIGNRSLPGTWRTTISPTPWRPVYTHFGTKDYSRGTRYHYREPWCPVQEYWTREMSTMGFVSNRPRELLFWSWFSTHV